MQLLSDPKTGTKCRVSSVLQQNNKVYGPKNVLDIENDSNCWNSEGTDGGTTQFIELDFIRNVQPQEIRIQFQAGFIAQSCSIQVFESDINQYQTKQTIEFEDVHSIQTMQLPTDDNAATTKIRLVFDDFTDFYGRIIVYRLEVWGEDVSEA
ncbi:hypothetical protein MPSEU_000810700 [Mayamaea pseudoterrestris]|nr:hypothetical protein MPSEU_000810700 [Mayamaea pseudoterrestris]